MRRAFSNWIATGAAGIAMLLMACSASAGDNLEHKNLVASAISENPESSTVRSRHCGSKAGPDSNRSTMHIVRRLTDTSLRGPSTIPILPGSDCSRALDGIAGQRDCYASQLFWYTDLEKAKAESKATGKPILSLRLMGNLTDEFSCANSRFFRTTLYANKEVSAALRDRFILHWQSVRPVPKVTIDFGDGRKLERHAHRQQHPLCARQRWRSDRRPARLVRAEGVFAKLGTSPRCGR